MNAYIIYLMIYGQLIVNGSPSLVEGVSDVAILFVGGKTRIAWV